MPLDQDTKAIYRDLSKKLAAKTMDNVLKSLAPGETPDLYWKLETAIYQALTYADTTGALRAKEELEKMLLKFETDDGYTRN